MIVRESIYFERGKSPKSALGIGAIPKFDEFAENAGLKRNELDDEEKHMLRNDEVLGKWQQTAKSFMGRAWYSGYVILFKDGETGELKVMINSSRDEDEYPAEQWMAQPIWKYHFGDKI